MKNPQTGFMIELPGTPIATVKVSALMNNADPDAELSLVRVVSGKIPGEKFTDLYVEEENQAR